MQDAPKAVWSILYDSVAFFPSLKHNFIAYRSSSRPHWIFEIHQLWQLGFSRVYSNSCCSCLFEAEIIKTGQSSPKMYSNNILNYQESKTILNACTKKKKSGNLLKAPRILMLQIFLKNAFISSLLSLPGKNLDLFFLLGSRVYFLWFRISSSIEVFAQILWYFLWTLLDWFLRWCKILDLVLINFGLI